MASQDEVSVADADDKDTSVHLTMKRLEYPRRLEQS